MKRLIECVPNFSEGRAPVKVDAIVAAMRSVAGVYVLDGEMDAVHNRSVVTLAGEPDAVADAALLGTGKAMELIDLTKHKGAHPRVGATDVLPFIPIDGVTIEDCVALARRVGNEIWKRYRIPVFFYEAAATRPDRVNLENVRRGQFEGLREEMKKNHERQPDVGEPKVHPTAGVTGVGARKVLIAYNVNLNTPDVGIANKIAKAIRFSAAGGAPAAAAGGGSVSGLAGALAASLGQMVAGLSRKKKSQAAYIDQLSTALDDMRRTAEKLTEQIDRDAESYDSVMAAFKLPQGNAQETRQREEAIQKATK